MDHVKHQLHQLLRGTRIPVVPVVAKRCLATVDDALQFLDTPSAFRDGPVEGVYLRYEEDKHAATGGGRDKGCTAKMKAERCKLVRPDFVQGITKHWMGVEPVKNRVDPMASDAYLQRCYSEAPAAAMPLAAHKSGEE